MDLGRQYASIKGEIDAAIGGVLASSNYILGEQVAAFERAWSQYVSTRHCVGVGSGTAALELAYEALRLGDGDEVIVPANTFVATVVPLLRRRARPVLVDCDEYGQIDADAVAAVVTERTRAVVGVHLFGHPCDVKGLEALCREHGLEFIEDAAQAHGAEYNGRRCGSFGKVAAFSFYPAKNLGAYGDAGAVVTDDGELADRLALLRDLGQRTKYEHVEVAPNERLDELQAAVLRVKLRHLDRWNDLRREHAAAYTDLLSDVVRTPIVAPAASPVWHLYVVHASNRDELRSALAEAGIESGLHYPIPLHLQPALSMLGYREGEFPRAEEWARTGLSLPMFPELERREIERVAEVVSGVAARALA